MVTTSFYLSPKTGIAKNETGTKKIEKLTGMKSEKTAGTESSSEALYKSITFEAGHELNEEVFFKALTGFENLKKAGLLNQDAHLLTVCDFSMSSNTKRLWVIDTEEKKSIVQFTGSPREKYR